MDARGLLLLLGPLALWTGLMATAPPKPTPPPAGGRSLQCQESKDCPTGHSCVAFRGMGFCEPTAAAGASTETSGASSLSNDKPWQPVGRPVDKTEAGPSGRASPSENPLLEVDSSANPVPSGKLLAAGSLDSASESAVPKKGCLSKKNTTSSGGMPVSSGQKGEPTSAHKPVNGSGHAGQSKPSPCTKPVADGKPASPAGHGAHETPAPGGKTAPNNGSVSHGKPTSGHKPAPHEKPESGGKPNPENQPETESEKEGDDSDNDDDDDDDNYNNEVKEDNFVSNEDEDGFDRELDYGLGESPFNPNDYHDAWSDEDSEDSHPGFEEDGPPDDAFSYNGEAMFDAWGDVVSQPASEPWPRKRSAEAGLLRDPAEEGGARTEAPEEAPPAGWIAQ